MKAVHFGAGNIGRGFLGQLYFESGYETTFIDVNDELVDNLNKRGQYPLRIVEDTSHTIVIESVHALHAVKQPEEVAHALAEADIASTAVGVGVLSRIAPIIAAGIAKRLSGPGTHPLNIIVCENMIAAGPYLRDQVSQHLSLELRNRLETEVGFVEASIGRMVPVMTAEQRAEDPLLVCVEPYCELPVDLEGFRGPIPLIEHMQPKSNFAAYVERKLFVHNAGHAVTAYLGKLRGHTYIWEAIADPTIAREVEASLTESQSGLAAKFGLDAGDLKAHADDIVRRFHNRALGDQVERVARDPLRKLGSNDRLIGAAQMCLLQGVTPEHLAFAVAAAIQYDHPDDPSARLLRELREAQGVAGVLTKVCEVAADSPLAELVAKQTQRLYSEGWKTK